MPQDRQVMKWAKLGYRMGRGAIPRRAAVGALRAAAFMAPDRVAMETRRLGVARNSFSKRAESQIFM